jgi:hypothetical protein
MSSSQWRWSVAERVEHEQTMIARLGERRSEKSAKQKDAQHARIDEQDTESIARFVLDRLYGEAASYVID